MQVHQNLCQEIYTFQVIFQYSCPTNSTLCILLVKAFLKKMEYTVKQQPTPINLILTPFWYLQLHMCRVNLLLLQEPPRQKGLDNVLHEKASVCEFCILFFPSTAQFSFKTEVYDFSALQFYVFCLITRQLLSFICRVNVLAFPQLYC